MTSTTPSRASPCTSARMSPIARERCGPRTSGTMQNVQALSQPGGDRDPGAERVVARGRQGAREQLRVLGARPSAGPSSSARRSRSSRCGSAWVPTTTSTHGAFSWIRPWSFCARQPATTIRRSGFVVLERLQVPEVAVELVVRVLADRARVQHDRRARPRRRRSASSRRPSAGRRSARNRARSSGTRRCGSGTSRSTRTEATCANSVARVSRTTVILIWPGYWSSSSTCLAMSRAITCAWRSSTSPGLHHHAHLPARLHREDLLDALDAPCRSPRGARAA